MLRPILTGLFACGGLVLGAAPPPTNPSLVSPKYVAPKYSLPQFDPNPSQRLEEVALNHAGYLYSAPLIGNSSYFPNGTLGSQRVSADVAAFMQNAASITQSIEEERGAVVQKVTQVTLIIHLSSGNLANDRG